EYQHFIPQFLFKNFSYLFVCLNTAKMRKKYRKPYYKKKKHPGSLVLNCLDILLCNFFI
ncbi:hypothetical protein BKA56DRAFT_481878, partial [Ilyonectria sp. MPI-CAGE-AT-0026]